LGLTRSGRDLGSFQGSKVAIIGIGNLLLGDEGVGVHVAQRLAEMIHSDDIQVIDAGTSPDIFGLVDAQKVVIIDAARAGGVPGTIYRFELGDLNVNSEQPLSLHELSLLDGLRVLSFLNRRPESVVIIGIEPSTVDFRLELSPQVERKLPEVMRLIISEIGGITEQTMEVIR